MLWLTQAQIDAHPSTEPPADFVPEKLRSCEHLIELEQLEDEEGSFGDSLIGGQPIWSDEAGEPEALPDGAAADARPRVLARGAGVRQAGILADLSL